MMMLYHQVRVGRQLLANQGSISSNVELEDDIITVNYQGNHLNHALRKVLAMKWPCLCTGVFRCCTCDPLKDLLIGKKTFRCCSTAHEVHEGLLQFLFGVQHFMIQARARVYSQSLQESHSRDDHIYAGIDPSEGRRPRAW